MVRGEVHVKPFANVKVRMSDEMLAQLGRAARDVDCSVPEMLRRCLLPEMRKASAALLPVERMPRQAPSRVFSVRPDLAEALAEIAEAADATKGEVLYSFASRLLHSTSEDARKAAIARSERWHWSSGDASVAA